MNSLLRSLTWAVGADSTAIVALVNLFLIHINKTSEKSGVSRHIF